MEVLGHEHKRAGAADNVLPVIILEAPRRIRVLGIPWDRSVAENDQAIDHDSLPRHLVTGEFYVTSGVIGPVAGNVDGAACGLERRALELAGGEFNAATDGGAVSK